jgi:hypothetical protein
VYLVTLTTFEFWGDSYEADTYDQDDFLVEEAG